MSRAPQSRVIPKIVHYVWVGPRPFPADAQARVDAWRRLLPDYQFMLWDEQSIDFTPRFVRQAYGVGAYNRVANYARMAALNQFGGVYMDHDVELLKSYGPMLEDGFFAGFQTMDAEAIDIVNNAVVGSVPGHPIVRAVLAALDERNGADEVGSGTGPGMLSAVLRTYGPIAPQSEPLAFHGAKLYPPRYFYPYEWFEEFSPDCVTPDTFAVHYWAALWKGPRMESVMGAKIQRRLTTANPTLAAFYRRLRNLHSKRAAAALAAV